MLARLEIPNGAARLAYALIALGWSAVQFFQIYTGGYQHEVLLLSTHVGAASSLVLLSVAAGRKTRGEDEGLPLHDALLVLAMLVAAGYFVLQAERVATRMQGVSPVSGLDQVMGTLFILVLLEACRRAAGIVLTAVAAVFIAYVFFGPYMPGALAHRGITFARFIDLQLLSTSGIFGTPISASAHMVFYFVMVGAFLQASGCGKLFVSIAYGLTARSWGGAGKAAVVSSGLFGMISGSAVANVLISGLMTIPLMIRSGLPRNMAGAVEAVASTGGQLAPPIMGAAAFILADIVGVPYVQVLQAAIIPALLFYVALFMVVHFYSFRAGLRPDRSYRIGEHLAELGRRWHLLLPLGFMVHLLIQRYSLMLVGSLTICFTVVVSLLRRATRMMPRDIYEALLKGARSAAEVAVPSAVAGIIVGTLVHTGMALRLQRWLLVMAGDSLLISLSGAMILTIVLGMGMPTAAAYLVSAILVAPALQQLGVPGLAAHMFILYFAILSMVTPPVALSAYAAAGISGGNLWATAMRAFLLAVPGFLIPYAFVFNPALIMAGTPFQILWAVGTATGGVVAFAAAVGGWLFGPMPLLLRLLLGLFAPLLIFPERSTDLIGAGLVALVVGAQFLWTRMLPRTEAAVVERAGED